MPNSNTVQLTDDDWSERFNAIVNHLSKHSGFCGYNKENENRGCLFETYGKEIEFVWNKHQENPRQVWTVIEGEDGESYLIAGFHYVNRLGFFISVEEWTDEDESKEFLFN